MYVDSDGNVQDKRSFSSRLTWNEIKRLFWSFIDIIVLFFVSIFNPEQANLEFQRKKDRFYTGEGHTVGRDDGKPPKRPMGQIRHNNSMSCPTSG